MSEPEESIWYLIWKFATRMINTNNNNLQPDSRVSILIAIIWEYNVEPSAKGHFGEENAKIRKVEISMLL